LTLLGALSASRLPGISLPLNSILCLEEELTRIEREWGLL
jgi:hypothetical protein